jgi:hypothetical protein
VSSEAPLGSWHVVVFKHSSFTALGSAMTRQGTYPAADYGSKCLCCDQETEARLSFDPSARHVASAISLPRCTACESHVSASNSTATTLMGLLCVGLLLTALGWKQAAFREALPLGLACFAAMGALFAFNYFKRVSMQKQGHCIGLEVVAIPGLVSVRTSNPRFARELRERNPDLVSRKTP